MDGVIEQPEIDEREKRPFEGSRGVVTRAIGAGFGGL
jgi:hypothetical protein